MERKLGRGLSSLIGHTKRDEIVMISLDRIKPSDLQPRKKFDEKKLKELAESIKEKGVIEPIIVRIGKNGYYEIVCGERRYKASQMAGLTKIPAIVKNLTDEEAFEISLIENIQREDLSPIEFALAFDKLTKLGYSHEDIARKIGKSRSYVTNILRILKLPEDIKKLIDEQKISLGHAKVLCSISEEKTLRQLVDKILKEKISVRELEEIVKKLARKNSDTPVIQEIEEKVKKIFPEASYKIKVRKDGKLEVRLLISLN